MKMGAKRRPKAAIIMHRRQAMGEEAGPDSRAVDSSLVYPVSRAVEFNGRTR
jgi:hypothetical protein